MIHLFHIPDYKIDTSKFNHLLHGDIVEEFTENFCKYVGASYGCAVNSATSAIFLISEYGFVQFQVPTMIPPVVVNAIINGSSQYDFTDDIHWIGHSYVMCNKTMRIIDSAQEVKHVLWDNPFATDVRIYSFYPTKPVGSCDGGMICSNDKSIIDFFRTISTNGTSLDTNSWNRKTICPGWKMYMNSIQAYIANENLKKLDEKKHNLKICRDIYNHEFGYQNSSDHLYTIHVKNNTEFVDYMKSKNIQCGIHYRCLHKQTPYCCHKYSKQLPHSEHLENHIVSIPFHEILTEKEIKEVIKCTKESGMLTR